jgi:hypothetical protein
VLARRANLATIIVVPLTVMGLVLAYMALVKSGSPDKPIRTADLELVDAAVINPRFSSTQAVPSIDVKLHNKGNARVVVSRAVVTVEQVARLDFCYSQGDLPASNTYDIELPTSPSRLTAPLNQQLGPDEADRFLLKFGVPAGALGGQQVGDTPHLFVYRMRLSLVSGAEREPLDLGRFIVSVPDIPFGIVWYWPKDMENRRAQDLAQNFGATFPYQTYMPCWSRNTERLRAILNRSGSRSPDLEQVRRDLARVVKAPT